MDAIIITIILGEDRRVVIDLPPDTPVGPIKLTIETDAVAEPKKSLTREEVRARLLAAGKLSTSTHAPERTKSLSPQEIFRIGKLSPGARPSEELIDEDRGPR